MQTHKAEILILVAFSLTVFDQIMAIETPKYKLIKKESGFEVRDYGPMIVASTSVESNYSDAASIGFRRIAGYIFGGNSAGMKIDMTAPVITNTPATREIYEIQFIMPSKHSFKDLPKPSAGNVSIKNINLGKTAVLKFGGWATKDRATYYKNKLIDLLESSGYEPTGSFLVAQYNSPWAIPPFRKNEIIVEIN